jgi:uracil-DNA glycosylase
MRIRERYLIELGLRPWVRRDTARAEASVPDVQAVDGLFERWRALEHTVSQCTACALHRGRTRTVFGAGNQRARLLVIGEAPGAEEDRRGEPFVGRAGQLLNAMLAAIGMDRSDVYIANILKCRPPGNRDPAAEEIATCTPYLREQIALQAPDVILAVGRIAAQWLLQTDTAVGRLRGQVHGFDAAAAAAGGTADPPAPAPGPASTHESIRIPVVVSYHPAYLLRTPQAKARAWDDLKQVRRLLGTATSPEPVS